MKLSDELVQGLAIGDAAARTVFEQIATAAALAEDRVWTEASAMARSRELLAQHPELTRPQAYAQAVMEIGEPAIGAAVASFALAKDDTMCGPPVIRIVSTSEEVLSITFPQNITLEDFDRMTAEIQAALDQAEQRGEQKALAFLLGWSIPPVKGILGQPELTKEQSDALADALATSEKRVATLLRQTAQICAELETDDHQANLD